MRKGFIMKYCLIILAIAVGYVRANESGVIIKKGSLLIQSDNNSYKFWEPKPNCSYVYNKINYNYYL